MSQGRDFNTEIWQNVLKVMVYTIIDFVDFAQFP